MPRKPRKISVLSPEQQALITNGMINYTDRLATKMSLKYALSLSEHEEIHGIGLEELSVTASLFDVSRNVKFITYATHRVRGSMLDHVRKLQGWRRKENRHCTSIEESDGLSNIFYGSSRGTSDGDPEGDPLGREIRSLAQKKLSSMPGPADGLEARETSAGIKVMIDSLEPLEGIVITLYYLEDLTFEQIGERILKGKSWVCRLHERALLKMRSLAAASL